MLTRAEASLASAASTLAFAILFAYAPYRIGWRVLPSLVLVVTIAAAIALARTLWRGAARSRPTAVAMLLAIAAPATFFLVIATPDLLPAGGGPDLAHHLVLINHIERNWKLVDDPALYPYLGDMMDYTPGSHLLLALAGAWTRAGALRAIHPMLTLTAALKAGFVFAIARRLSLRNQTQIAGGLIAVLLLFVPLQYFAGSFATHSYWPQVVAELFACAAWWSVVVWTETRHGAWLGLFALFATATFVTWPVWVGPLVVLVSATIVGPGTRRTAWPRDLAIALLPVLVVAAVHTAGRTGRLQMAATTGFAIQPSAATLGWAFIIAAAAGIAACAARPTGRTALLFVGAIAAQAIALYAIARYKAADTPYLALKMMYLAIYPLAVAGAVAISVRPAVAWLAAAALLPVTAYRVMETPRSKPIVTLSAWQAGLWARDHVDRACVDYLVADGYTGYWLHLAVLDNPRGTKRFDDPGTFDPQKAIERWVDIDGLPYAIVDDVNGFAKPLFNGTDTVARFDPSIVIKRRGRAVCGER